MRHAMRFLLALLTLPLLGSALACDDDPSGPTVGSLAVSITGLPSGINTAVTVTGPAGFSRALTSSETLTGLAPGAYTVSAADVTASGDTYRPSQASQTITVVARTTPATATVVYSIATGRLVVTISGLPAGTDAAVTVTGPGGFNRALTSSQTLTGLSPGTYTIAAADVNTSGGKYRPNQANQTIAVVAATTPSAASVVYSIATGALTVNIGGLPAGTDAAVTVTGPGGFTRTLTASATLTSLAPGSYTITAANVATSLTTHVPTPASQSATVTAGATATATVNYTSSPLSLRLEQVVSSLASPVYLTAPPNDARLFIVEQGGRIRIFQNGQLLATPFLEISARIAAGGEQGLLSLAFHPQYSTNGFFFVYFTERATGDITVERYTVSAGNSNVANPTPTPIISIQHRFAANHNGGLVMFGTDGMLYLATGDGGGGGDPQQNGQNTNTLLGKMLRLDVSTVPYTIPPSNPFYQQPGKRGEIWAYGLRNPWRFAFDRVENRLYIADVGQNLWEEVNVANVGEAGLNYGWNIMEGAHCYATTPCNAPGLTLPVLEYSHSEGCSVTGGFVYRGSRIPELAGHYLYSDYCSGWLRSFRYANGAATERRDWNIANVGNITSFGEDATGELYMLSASGGVYRIVRQ